MIANLLIGGAVMMICLAIQCLFVGLTLGELKMLKQRRLIHLSWYGAALILIAVMSIILAGNLVQISLWAGLFVWLGEWGDFSTAFYHSVVNFSTLGYGDLVMSSKRRLLGALEALNGVLMIGLSTSLLFAVLSKMMQDAWASMETLATMPGKKHTNDTVDKQLDKPGIGK